MKGRARLLVRSVLIAAVGTGLIYAYVRSADTRANAGKTVVNIAYAQKDIPAGTSAADVARQYLNFKPVNQASMVTGAVTKGEIGELQKMTTSRAITTIKKSDPVLLQLFQAAPAGARLASGNPKNVSVEVEVEGAAAGVGLLQVGQPTIVFVTIKGTHPSTRILFPKATVISLNGVTGADDATGGAQKPDGGQGTVGLSIPLQDAEKVALAHEYSDKLALYFGLPGSGTIGVQEVTMPDLTRAVAG